MFPFLENKKPYWLVKSFMYEDVFVVLFPSQHKTAKQLPCVRTLLLNELMNIIFMIKVKKMKKKFNY
ncbi:hypothetical protein N473_03130 [Pseudoalteromonas luteoviolacea CPMOR-1]|uniref:Uncharacterized protein n=1 Tax=Pseudoalteromonas luteoviolacea CPMOR-1 TaxID=1365248 RepID=A0A167IBV3_9GAMM|nr:hypothetical protein N473_03130 [Pseudoalteromonas luteoviolacea CPMOR-1]